MATTTGTPLGTKKAMTWEAFERLPDGDGLHREIIHGELHILPPAKFGHTMVAKRVFIALLEMEGEVLGQALTEAGYKLSEDPPTWVQPDVSFLRADRVQATDPSGYALGAPDLAVEVVSPSESVTDLQRKATLLLAAGSLAVWVVNPEDRTVTVHLPDGTTSTRATGQTLDAPFLIEGWSVEVAKLFEH